MINKRYHGNKLYQIMVDEVLHSLYNITINESSYTSIFDDPFLAKYKQIHDEYGTVFVLGLHYKQSPNIAWGMPFDKSSIGWTIDQMTDKFKDEWKQNSDWLKSCFHSYEYDVRYKSTSRSMAEDMDLIKSEVVRFAGEECWLEQYGKTHGVEGYKEDIQAYLDRGYKYLEANPEHVHISNTAPLVSYYLNTQQHNELFETGTYYDESNGMLFVAGAGNITRIAGVIPGGAEGSGDSLSTGMYEYLDNYTSGNYYVNKKIDFLPFVFHEPVMFKANVLVVNSVQQGDSIMINGINYIAGNHFEVGANNDETATNLWSAIDTSVYKYGKRGNIFTVAGADVVQNTNSIFVRSLIGEVEEVARWCQDNGYKSSFMSDGSFYKWVEPAF